MSAALPNLPGFRFAVDDDRLAVRVGGLITSGVSLRADTLPGLEASCSPDVSMRTDTLPGFFALVTIAGTSSATAFRRFGGRL